MMEPLLEMRIGPPPEIIELEENINQKLSNLSEEYNLDIEDLGFLLSLETMDYQISDMPDESKEAFENSLSWDAIEDYFFNPQRDYIHEGCANSNISRGDIRRPFLADGSCYYNFKPLDKESEEKIKKGEFNGEPGLMACQKNSEEKPRIYYIPPQGVLGPSGSKFNSMVEGEPTYVKTSCEDIDCSCPLSDVKVAYEIKDFGKVVDFIEKDIKKGLSYEEKEKVSKKIEEIKDYFVEKMEEIDDGSMSDEDFINVFQNQFQGNNKVDSKANFEVR